ncbi:MAG: diguanylate cyclase domain-containing protein, partial [Bacillota bacterium]
ILPECNREQARDIWQRVEDNLDEFNKQGDRDYRLSLSHGLAEYRRTQGMDYDNLIKRADDRMYREKHRHHSREQD